MDEARETEPTDDVPDILLDDDETPTEKPAETPKPAKSGGKKGFQLGNEHVRLIGVVVVLLGLVGAGYGAWQWINNEPIIPPGITGAESTTPLNVVPEEEEIADAPDTDMTDMGTTDTEPFEPVAVAPEPTPVKPEPVRNTTTTTPSNNAATTTATETEKPARATPPPRRAPTRTQAPPKTVAPLEKPLSAYEQLMRQRRLAEMEPLDDSESLNVHSLDRRTIQLAFHAAGDEFVRLMVEDAAGVASSSTFSSNWAQVKQSAEYARTMRNIY
ncbi:MAG: hypothetical protein O3A46_02810, partial [Candidatus Poribacteria bacterium]|nr:hypothetical protein [Candidatus Poribacteria bacterium]